MKKHFEISWVLALVLLSSPLFAQKLISYNLADLHQEGKLIIQNREVIVKKENGKSYIKINGGVYAGAVWLPIDNFTNGKIEILARGKDVAQGSFYGIAFHAVNDSTFDDVYCRPFNFKATDSLRKIHAIQYVSYPLFDWPKLRKEFNGIYEKGIENPPNAHDWVTFTIHIEGNDIKAYINHAEKPSLVVKKLNKNANGRIGITGFNCDIMLIRILPSK